MKNNFIKLILAATITLTFASNAIPTYAASQSIGEFSNFKVTYSGGEKLTPSVSKWQDNGNAFVDLSKDSGTAWITANIRNSDGLFRGGCNVQRGKKATFATTGSAAHAYRLGLSKTNNIGGGSVTIKGSWSPDAN